MTRFLFLTWDGGGNEPPAIGLAQELQKRGHHVTFAGYASQQGRFTQRGFPFVLLQESQSALEAGSSEDGLGRFVEGILVCAPQLTEVPEVFTREHAEVLVVDCMLFAAVTAAQRAHLPTAVLVHSPPGALLHPDRILGQAALQPLNAMRADAGLVTIDRLWEMWRGMVAVCTSIPQLDPLRDEIPPECVYVGPIVERVSPSGWRGPWARGDERSLILVSFSTGEGFPQRSRIERTIAGLATMPYRVLVTTSRADVRGITVPENAVLIESVPHLEILPEVAVTVTHAGHGTILSSLTHGVPLVCLPNPLIADQIPLAVQVERLGAGRVLDGEAALPADIASVVDEVATAPAYRAAAHELARIIAAMPGAAAAVHQLERATEGPRPRI